MRSHFALLAPLAAALVLGACDGGGSERPREAALKAPAPVATESARVAGLMAADDARAEPESDLASAGLLLAYTYGAEIQTPAEAVRPLMAAHEQACRAAGPKLCVVFGSNVSENGDYAWASLNLRAAPGWLTDFRAGLAADAEEAGGRLTSTTMNADDLTRQIVDTEARVKALTTLRDRLQTILENRPGSVKELLDVERELARVQGELDATASRLAVMRQRIDMSVLNISYSSQPKAVSRGVFAPLADALTGALGAFIESVATVITIVVAAIPFLVIGAPILWWLARLVFRRRKKG